MKFFATGGAAIKAGLNLNFITPAGSQSGNFADEGQTLHRSFAIAENIFRLVGRGEINFVLIGLTPYSLFQSADNTNEAFAQNLLNLDNCIALCRQNGATPVVFIPPFAPAARQRYRKNFGDKFLTALAELKKIRDFKIVNLFDFNLPENCFADSLLNASGAAITSALLTLKLHELKTFTDDDLCRMNYEYFNFLSQVTGKNFFHSLMDKMFAHTFAALRRKEKIRVAFAIDNAAMWCGDKLYNLFAKNPRFETTVFLCRGKVYSLQDMQQDITRFKTAGINVVGIIDLNEKTPPQDIVFFLRPYFGNFSKSFQFDAMTPQTILAHVPYTALSVESIFFSGYFDSTIFHIAWKFFAVSEPSLKLYDEKCSIGLPRGVVSGAPKLDVFFDDVSEFEFPWKMARPDAKKIIWAPHHSFVSKKFSNTSTFPHNFRFMYEFAKAHPEISWVVKPHPRLAVSSVEAGLFPSAAAYNEYMQKWNDLPNAQVYTGGYYQRIFATSDGMIHDCVSFIAEYQYTHKPMIYLINDAREEFTDLGKKILDVSYLVDGKNFDAIADAIQKIFIEGNDRLRGERLKVFDELLNYRKRNGMSASDFIFQTVAKELEMI